MSNSLLTLADLDCAATGATEASAAHSTAARLLQRCTEAISDAALIDLATERDGNDARSIGRAIADLLRGIEVRHGGDARTAAAVAAITDWHLPDLIDQAEERRTRR